MKRSGAECGRGVSGSGRLSNPVPVATPDGIAAMGDIAIWSTEVRLKTESPCETSSDPNGKEHLPYAFRIHPTSINPPSGDRIGFQKSFENSVPEPRSELRLRADSNFRGFRGKSFKFILARLQAMIMLPSNDHWGGWFENNVW